MKLINGPILFHNTLSRYETNVHTRLLCNYDCALRFVQININASFTAWLDSLSSLLRSSIELVFNCINYSLPKDMTVSYCYAVMLLLWLDFWSNMILRSFHIGWPRKTALPVLVVTSYTTSLVGQSGFVLDVMVRTYHREFPLKINLISVT